MTIKIEKGNVVSGVLEGECHLMIHITNAQQAEV